jgi:hypothetical protein
VTGAGLLARARATGAVLTAAHGRIVVDGASRLPPDLLAGLRAHKAELLALLADDAPVPVAKRLADMRAACATREAALIGAFDHPDVATDRAAIAAEPLLPAPGTPERDRLDARQGEALAGLLAGFGRHRPLP